MGIRKLLASWPALRQAGGPDRLGLGQSVQSARSTSLTPRTDEADEVVGSICPYCAVGCGQRVFVKDGKVHPDRGGPGQPHLPGPAVPEGFRQQAAGH